MNEIERTWLEAVESLGKDTQNKGMGDLFIESLLVATNLAFIPAELREKADLRSKLDTLRIELNRREQNMALAFKILKEKGLI